MRYWQATLFDGSTVREPIQEPVAGKFWKSVQTSIASLSLIDDEESIEITVPSGMKSYEQGKTASVAINGDNFQIESRWIGFHQSNGQLVKLRIKENSKQIKVEIQHNAL